MTGKSEQLTAQERIVLMATIPTEGSYLDMKLVRKFRESLSFSEEEHEALGFVINADGSASWEGEDPNKAIYFGKRMESIIIESLVALYDAKKLKEEHIPLYDRFVGAPDE
jgi:hypothetical protein